MVLIIYRDQCYIRANQQVIHPVKKYLHHIIQRHLQSIQSRQRHRWMNQVVERDPKNIEEKNEKRDGERDAKRDEKGTNLFCAFKILNKYIYTILRY